MDEEELSEGILLLSERRVNVLLALFERCTVFIRCIFVAVCCVITPNATATSTQTITTTLLWYVNILTILFGIRGIATRPTVPLVRFAFETAGGGLSEPAIV